MEPEVIHSRKLPKLLACMTKTSLENMRNKALFNLDLLDAKGIRRRKQQLYKCLILELREAGFSESADYLQDLLYDNVQLVAEDEIGIVVDLRERNDYLEHICAGLQKAEKERDRDKTDKECAELLKLALHYAEKGKGILWLAEKFYLASIAIASKYLLDGGRLKCVCKYHYSKFLLDKFPGAETEEAFSILSDVRECSNGKTWPLYMKDKDDDNEAINPVTIFVASSIELQRVLLVKARCVRQADPAKAERLSRLAERRANDAEDSTKQAEAIIEIGISQLMMNNLNNALRTFGRALKIVTVNHNLEGICDTKMHLSSVLQRLGDYEGAARNLTEMGKLAMENSLRLQLGRALHLLGELHLRRDRPELGTEHLSEAFICFMAFNPMPASEVICDKPADTKLSTYYDRNKKHIYLEEAEESRFMTSISAGQELMPSYFVLLRQAENCAVARVKCIEWKLSNAGWWVKKRTDIFIPCTCPVHNRTPLDVLRIQIEIMLNEKIDESELKLERASTVQDMRQISSSIVKV